MNSARLSAPNGSLDSSAVEVETWSFESSRPKLARARLDLRVEVFATGLIGAANRNLKTEVQSTSFAAASGLKSVSMKIKAPPVRTIGFTFPETASAARLTELVKQSAKTKPARSPRSGSRTRLQPPEDIVKLEDRLFYVLQPPLEQIVSTGEVRFPFDPFPYQYEGIAFLYTRFAAVLADEMGLGKTMQAITTIRLLLMAGELRRVLLVCPKPLVTNWLREFNLWAPETPVGVIEGDRSRREFQWQRQETPVVIANYELLMRDRDFVNDESHHYDLVVLDEAQRIKNRSSTTSQVVKAIPRSRSWALTGTPVENSPEDLVGIFDFVSPGQLRSEMSPRRMGAAVGDYIVRRTKDMVLKDLPPKMYRDAELTLTPEQWATYRIAEDEGVVKLTELGDELTIQHVFQLVLRLKQICNFDPTSKASSKMERLQADLGEVAACGHKAIIFSQWVQSLYQIREGLPEMGVLEYHGKIPSRKRDAIIDQFRNDPDQNVLLMSYGAGSVGLNLQFCQYVFLFDRWWNPAVEDQAINRAHRIGAAGPVTVTRMMMVETIEERIHQVLEEKRELFEMILSNTGDPRTTGLSQNEIFGLFNLKS